MVFSHESWPSFPKERRVETVQQQSWVQSAVSRVITVLCGDREKGEEHSEVHDEGSTIPTETLQLHRK